MQRLSMSRRSAVIGVLALLLVTAALPQAADPPRALVEADGTVHMPAQSVPVSGFLSREGKQYLAEHLHNLQRPELLIQEDGVPALLAGYIARQRELFPVEREDTTIGGVHAYVYTPRNGIAPENRDRVLVELHGGGFSGCWPACAVKHGIDAALHVWEGMFHGFFYNPDVPESRDCYDVVVRFFAGRLGRG